MNHVTIKSSSRNKNVPVSFSSPCRGFCFGYLIFNLSERERRQVVKRIKRWFDEKENIVCFASNFPSIKQMSKYIIYKDPVVLSLSHSLCPMNLGESRSLIVIDISRWYDQCNYSISFIFKWSIRISSAYFKIIPETLVQR